MDLLPFELASEGFGNQGFLFNEMDKSEYLEDIARNTEEDF